jgi:DNA-binding NtrC family response regulator
LRTHGIFLNTLLFFRYRARRKTMATALWFALSDSKRREGLMPARPLSAAREDYGYGAKGCADGISSRIVGNSESIRTLRAAISTIAGRGATVLIEGETGVGKEVVAREIHALSPRANQPFIPVDFTTLSLQLIESQLFGHVKGAFTGAADDTLGFIRCADRGTLFLDEIGEMPLSVQSKLLRAIQERTVVPVGGREPIAIDVRIVAATHRNLAQMVRDGDFREDLYFRLNVVRLRVPPLRNRREDIPLLAQQFLREVAMCYAEPIKDISSDVVDLLGRYDWSGNVRELRNAMERAFLFCGGPTIELSDLPLEIQDLTRKIAEEDAAGCAAALDDDIPHLAIVERTLIARALKRTGGNQSDAARLLDIRRHRLRRKIVLHGLEHLARMRPR